MSSIKKILVPFDDNLISIRALEYAAMFASGIGAKITVFHLADPSDYHSQKEFKEELNALVEQQLRPKFADIRATYPDIRKIEIQTRGLEKPIYQHIVEFAKENDFDFIIARSHGLPNAEDWELHFKSTTAHKIVLDAPCPVFTFTKVPETPKMKNILVPLDLIEGSLYKLPFVISLANQFNATIHLISASEHADDNEALQQQLDEIGYELQRKRIKTIKSNISKNTLPEAIDHYTKNNDIDLISIMSRPGFRWSDLWVSPKAKRIIARSKVPVLSIRSDKPMDIDL